MCLEPDEICGAGPEEYLTEEERPVRPLTGDHKPEYLQYKDEGCKRAPSCLSCPFPQCIYDVKGGQRRRLKKLRNEEMARLYESGRKITGLARRYKLNQRTVERIIKDGKRKGEI